MKVQRRHKVHDAMSHSHHIAPIVPGPCTKSEIIKPGLKPDCSETVSNIFTIGNFNDKDLLLLVNSKLDWQSARYTVSYNPKSNTDNTVKFKVYCPPTDIL